MKVETLIWDAPDPPHETFLERPFRPLEPLNLWTYRDLGALYPFDHWTLEPQEKPFIPWTLKPLDYGNTRP